MGFVHYFWLLHQNFVHLLSLLKLYLPVAVKPFPVHQQFVKMRFQQAELFFKF
jgi:hypothetical protein